jgi:5S rRNA maturation endonuclease (ribonuclease M5)
MEIANLCDDIAMKFDEIIILTDWDRRGWQLCKKIVKNLKGRTKCNTEFHKIFAEYSMVKDVEGIPSFIKKLKAKITFREP